MKRQAGTLDNVASLLEAIASRFKAIAIRSEGKHN